MSQTSPFRNKILLAKFVVCSVPRSQGDRYRVIRGGSDLGFVALEDGRPMPRVQRDENPSEGLEELPLFTTPRGRLDSWGCLIIYIYILIKHIGER